MQELDYECEEGIRAVVARLRICLRIYCFVPGSDISYDSVYVPVRSEHLRTGYEKELNDHWNKLEQAHLGLGEALKAEDDEQINLQVTEAGKVIDAMVKGAFKTIKPQLVPCLVPYC